MDTSAPLAANREAMWQETRANLQSGAFGDPSDLRTLISFWSKMELLHYPGAGETRKELEKRLAEQLGQTAPGQTVPGQTLPGQTAPGQDVAAQMLPGQETPVAAQDAQMQQQKAMGTGMASQMGL